MAMREPNSPSDRHPWPFMVPSVMSKVRTLFRDWFRNKELRDHMELVQAALNDVRGLDSIQMDDPFHRLVLFQPNVHHSTFSFVTFHHLFERSAPSVNQLPKPLGIPEIRKESHQMHAKVNSLQSLLSELQSHQKSTLYRRYASDLEKSRISFSTQVFHAPPTSIPYSMEAVARHRDQCRNYIQDVSASIFLALSPLNEAEVMMQTAGLWPRVTSRSLLDRLAFDSSSVIKNSWRRVLITFAQGILLFQRSQRLLRWVLLQNYEEFFKELENEGCWNQDVTENLDWLLIQVGY